MLNSNQIQEIIPHRYPFLLVDRIIELEAGVKAVGIKNVSVNEPFFQGHFPQEHIMPGVLIIEAMAQVGAVAILSLPQYQGKIAYFAGIKEAKFRRKVIPGDTLRLEITLVTLRGSFGIGEAKAYVDGQLAVEATLTFGF